MLPVERQVSVVFELISQASPSLGALGEVQIRGQVTEAPSGGTVLGWAPTPLFQLQETQSLCFPPAAFIHLCRLAWKPGQGEGTKEKGPGKWQRKACSLF